MTGGLRVDGAGIAGTTTSVLLGSASGFPCIWFAQATPSITNYAFLGGAGIGATVINSSDLTPNVVIRLANSNVASFTAGTMDLTGSGAGGSIKLKSPDGTTYTVTIANGGTLLIS